jgi:hypothetical protein
MVDFDRAVFSGGTVSFDGAARPELAGTAAAPANICATGRRAASSPDPYRLAFRWKLPRARCAKKQPS